MVEEFETLTLVHKALDLKTRDLVELGAFRGGSAIELILLLEDVKEACVEYFRTAAVSDRAVENMWVFLGISDSATRHGHIASANTRVTTDRRFYTERESIRSGPSLAYPAV
jgi:phosphoenolpyruvate carboxylase